MLGAVGAGITAEWIPEMVRRERGRHRHRKRVRPRSDWHVYFGFFVFLWAVHLFRLGKDQAGAGAGDDP